MNYAWNMTKYQFRKIIRFFDGSLASLQDNILLLKVIIYK